jgi:multiple sugar transport system substrate-binding protein
MGSYGWRRRAASVALAALTVCGLAGCGSGESGPPTLNWYINPDSGGQAEIANRCTEAAGGQYRIAVSVLPRESSEQREQLIRRLAAEDSSIDLMSLDPPYIPEFSEAGFLAPVPDDVAGRVTEGVLPSALAGATWDGRLVTVPFWANTQLLWYKKSAARAAGLDMSQPVTWDQVIDAAQSQNTQFAVQGRRAESLTVWINALVESGGGAIIVDPAVDEPGNIRLGLDQPPATGAARIMRKVADTGVGGPALSTAGEDENVSAFESGAADFMVNWPFVWPRANEAVEAGTLQRSVVDDYGWTLYPQTAAGRPSAPPLGGINLGVSSFSSNQAVAWEAVECLVQPENQLEIASTGGLPPVNETVYDSKEIEDVYPGISDLIRTSIDDAVARPAQSPAYQDITQAIQRAVHPTDKIDPENPAPVYEELREQVEEAIAREGLL